MRVSRRSVGWVAVGGAAASGGASGPGAGGRGRIVWPFVLWWLPREGEPIKMLPRVLEPEAMDSSQEARDYDAMDHSRVNSVFVADFLAVHGASRGGRWLDLGCGSGRIAIELARADPSARIVALDIAQHMITLARTNVAAAGLAGQVECVLGDAKGVEGYAAGAFEALVSNSIIHHIADPTSTIAEMVRMTKPGGTVFVRDLVRPDRIEILDRLVATYTGNEADSARELFRASLHAAFSIDELRAILRSLGLPDATVAMTSDRHWTWDWKKDR